MSTTDCHRFGCGVCLDFGYLPDVGPCPRCHPAEYADYVLAWARDVQDREAAETHHGHGGRFDAA